MIVYIDDLAAANPDYMALTLTGAELRQLHHDYTVSKKRSSTGGKSVLRRRIATPPTVRATIW